jgi:hypothetical protein
VLALDGDADGSCLYHVEPGVEHVLLRRLPEVFKTLVRDDAPDHTRPAPYAGIGITFNKTVH